jgi:hypothetical protein
MNWAILAAVGQLAAILIGIPSLVYLAIQIREQTRERRCATINTLAAQWSELLKSLNDSAEFSAIIQPRLQIVTRLAFALLLSGWCGCVHLATVRTKPARLPAALPAKPAL